ncbi:MAG: NAD-dependent epimerase/dehydratase family protein [Actinobacteria bacterium]|nr:NAD-dependent epimerase/dehydratase family protein [Actinomycetota bacterium]
MILVTGGAGVMGSRLVKELVRKGNRVRVLTLPGDPKVSLLDNIDCEIVYGNITDASSLKGIFNGIKTVYHLAAIIIAYNTGLLRDINIEGTRNIVTGSLNAGVEHFIYVSSVSAEQPEGSDYARSKITAEDIVRSQNKMRYTIVRPTLTYGFNEGQEFMMFMEYLKKYPVVFFIGRGKAKKNPVMADDIVKGLVKIVHNSKTFGKTYNFCGNEEISIWDLAKLMLKHQGISRYFIPVPIPVCNLIASVMEKTMKKPPLTKYAISRILQEAAVDSTEAKKDLGYDPAGVSEGLQICYPI